MTDELVKKYKVPQMKRVMLQISAVVLFSLGTIPSIPTSIFLRSILPFIGGIYLAFLAYGCVTWASQTMRITSEGVLLENRRGQHLLRWSDVCEFTQGKGINRYRVAYKLASDVSPSQINLGLFYLRYPRVHYLPDTFGIKANELATLLDHTKKEKMQQIASADSGEVQDMQS